MSLEAPINIHSEPDGLEGRQALLLLVTITKQSIDQSRVGVKCKLCDKPFAGTTERMAAHFANKTNFGVAKCTKPTPEATALGAKVLKDLETKRARVLLLFGECPVNIQQRVNNTENENENDSFLFSEVCTLQWQLQLCVCRVSQYHTYKRRHIYRCGEGSTLDNRQAHSHFRRQTRRAIYMYDVQ